MIHGGPWDRDSQNKGSRGSGDLLQLNHYAEAPLWHMDPGNLKEKDGFNDRYSKNRQALIYISLVFVISLQIYELAW